MLKELTVLFSYLVTSAIKMETSLQNRLLNQIEESLETYKTYFNNFYRLEKKGKDQERFFDMISSAISQEEALMVSNLLSSPIRLLSNYPITQI